MYIPTEREVQNGVAGFYFIATAMVFVAIGMIYGLWQLAATYIP